jgi:molecular chaperone HtpG
LSPVENSKLFTRLGELSEPYHARVVELRDTVAGWLQYVPATFPQYTQHGVQHGDQIVEQLSLLLFAPDSAEPTVALSPIELYVLILGAYLHDTGMVVSDAEKLAVLKSDEWEEWCESTPSATGRLAKIEELRTSPEPPKPEVAQFLADAQLRYLLSDFFRHRHHIASGRFVTANQPELARFGFDDPVLTATVAAVCEGHGLEQQDLDDTDKYPQRRTIRNDEANVRFLALLLRLGDLLDMSVDRACPLLQVAACPLPADSLAHWSQYQRITHRLVAPDRLELRAACETQDEHRYLVDWCEWLTGEAEHADVVMARAERHGTWSAPKVSLYGNDATIKIEPSPTARYIPSTWSLELDQDFVFQRLIRDTYADDLTFIRELIQNAADASRVRALNEAGRLDVRSVTELPKSVRDGYPIDVSVEVESSHNELSQTDEERMVVVIEDQGTGMDESTIKRFFLQVGRSLYQSREFRDKYKFVPSSKFGLGFLSVFAVSDYVTVETRHFTSGEPLRLTLTGPRSYLLTEIADRDRPGTRIEVRLRDGVSPEAIREAIAGWCLRLEFPLRLRIGEETTVIEAESADSFVEDVPDLSVEGGRLAVRSFPVDRDGIEGELYLLSRVAPDGSESWADSRWIEEDYLGEHPGAVSPLLPPTAVCAAGIAVSPLFPAHGGTSLRIDVRKPLPELPMARTLGPQPIWELIEGDLIGSRWEEVLRDHLDRASLAQGEDGWQYKQRLMGQFAPGGFWLDEPGTVPVHRRGVRDTLSVAEAGKIEPISTTIVASHLPKEISREEIDRREQEGLATEEARVLTEATRRALSQTALGQILEDRKVVGLKRLEPGHILVTWRHDDSVRSLPGSYDESFDLVPMDNEEVLGFTTHHATERVASRQVANANHPAVQWVVRVVDAADDEDRGVPQGPVTQLCLLLDKAISYGGVFLPQFLTFVEHWGELGLPEELEPPAGMKLEQSSCTPSL